MGEGREAYRKAAKRLIDTNSYVVLATVGEDGKPWSATVAYTYDKDYNFYFLSAVDSRHAENIEKNPQVSFVIFDSRQRIGSSQGIQAEGEAKMVPDKDLKKVIELYARRLFPKDDTPALEKYPPQDYSGASEFRFFKIKVSTVHITGTQDRRTEVDLGGSEE